MKTDSDEIIFLKALSKVISDKYVLAQKLGKPITKKQLFIDKDFRLFQIDDNILRAMHLLASELKCSLCFSNGSLYQYLDGMIDDHPILGTRLIEFDEEQHFNFFRKITLNAIQAWFEHKFWINYLSFCADKYYQKRMLKKLRINFQSDKIIDSFLNFQNIIQTYSSEGNGYVEAKSDFPFIGGRVAQRAYFDTIRDIAEFDKRNTHLKSILRFSKIEIEKTYQKDFCKMTSNQIEEYIEMTISKI